MEQRTELTPKERALVSEFIPVIQEMIQNEDAPLIVIAERDLGNGFFGHTFYMNPEARFTLANGDRDFVLAVKKDLIQSFSEWVNGL